MTQIEWTHLPGFKGESWNPIVGCSVVSPGCTNCYAMKFANARLDGNANAPQYAGTTRRVNGKPVWTGQVGRARDESFTAPLRARKPRCYFVNSMGDLFAENVPDEWIDQVFAVMSLSPQHRFIVLTKRPERMRDYLLRQLDRCDGEDGIVDDLIAVAELAGVDWREAVDAWPLPNVWLGVSVEDQARADERIPLLLDTPAAVRFISAEPLLGPVNLNHMKFVDTVEANGATERGFESALNGRRFDPFAECDDEGHPKLDWVICGGESGPGARPMHPGWARSLRDQCAAAGVPFFFKQWGEWAASGRFMHDVVLGPGTAFHHPRFPHVLLSGPASPGRTAMFRVGKRASGHLLDGVEHFNWPADPAGVPA